MNNSDILFVVPTIMNRPLYEILNLENCAKNFPESRFLFISNIEDDNFSNYQPTLDNIEKHVSGVQYSISEAINKGYSLNNGEKYFCFLQPNSQNYPLRDKLSFQNEKNLLFWFAN